MAAIDAKADGSASDVSSKPAQTSAAAPPLPTTTSDIGASASVTLSALSSALTAALPSNFDASGRQKVCADLNEVVQQQIQKKIGGDVGRWLSRAMNAVAKRGVNRFSRGTATTPRNDHVGDEHIERSLAAKLHGLGKRQVAHGRQFEIFPPEQIAIQDEERGEPDPGEERQRQDGEIDD